MSKMGRLLDNDEVEFLLNGGGGEPDRATSSSGSKQAREDSAREVTMRGDLDKINLSDIFQTLAMSKMEGLLRVRGPLESREIHFQDGFVRCLIARRVETLRLGQRLVRAGILTADQLRSTLLEQRKSKRSLGTILAERQLATTEDIDDVVHNQLQDDLFALFTWPHGTFEFYKGEVTDPVILDRLASVPRFEVNGVLLEVARRSDEWMMVMDTVGSLDEIVIATCTAEEIPAEASEDTRDILQAADGRASIRDLADITLIGLFDCGLTIRDLLRDGWLRQLTLTEMLDAVAATVEAGEPRRAVAALRAALQRNEHRDIATIKRIGELMGRCGEQRRAAAVLVEAARNAESADDSLELAREARVIDRLSPDALSFLTGQLRSREDTDPEELVDVLTDLCDVLCDRAEYDEARLVVEELEQRTEDLPLCRPRNARILAKLGWTDDAVDSLLGLVELYKERGDKERIAATYEQILRIDYRRKDIARALKGLHASKLARRGRAAAIAATVLALAFVGVVQVQDWQRGVSIGEARNRVRAALQAGDPQLANTIAQDSMLRFGDGDDVLALQDDINRFERERERAAKLKLEQIREHIEVDAREMLRNGRCEDALAAIAGLQEFGIGLDPQLATIRAALAPLRVRFEEIRRSLPEPIPPEPSITQAQAVQREILSQLEASLSHPERLGVAGLVQLRDDPRIRDALSSKDHTTLFAEVDALNRLFGRLSALRESYLQRLERRSLALELTPMFHEAREHEKANRFEAARDAYLTLARNHPEDDELKAHFEERVERYSTILKFLGLIETAAEEGDFQTAQGQLRALKRQFPELPLDSIARLPVRIRTTPPGARVLVDDQLVGQAPVLTSYRPAAETRIRVELDGFVPEETVLTGDSYGVVRSLLARVPHWVAQRDATIDRAPTPASGDRMFVADRAGTISLLRSTDGAVLWSRATGDLSGLLTRVLLLERADMLVCGSIDGPLRCLRAADGTEHWELPDLPTESTPVSIDELIVIATDDARAVGIDSRDGTIRWSTPLPGPVRADLATTDERHLLAVTSLGEALCLDGRTGRVVWRTKVGHGVACAPALRDGDAVIVAEDGSATRIDLRSGRVRWNIGGFQDLVLTPAILADLVLIADGRELHALDGRTGQRKRTTRMSSDLRTHLAVIDDLVFVGDANGLVTALGTDDLEPRFVIRADGQAIPPIVRLADGTLLGAFQDRTLRAFRPVPFR